VIDFCALGAPRFACKALSLSRNIQSVADHRRDNGWQQCALCERNIPARLITLHHLKPEEKGGKANDRVALCRPCHKQLHATFSTTELARTFNTVPSLLVAPRLQGLLRWVRKQSPDRVFRTAVSKAHPRAKRLRLQARRRLRHGQEGPY
jgi:hypothetical protein